MPPLSSRSAKCMGGWTSQGATPGVRERASSMQSHEFRSLLTTYYLLLTTYYSLLTTDYLLLTCNHTSSDLTFDESYRHLARAGTRGEGAGWVDTWACTGSRHTRRGWMGGWMLHSSGRLPGRRHLLLTTYYLQGRRHSSNSTPGPYYSTSAQRDRVSPLCSQQDSSGQGGRGRGCASHLSHSNHMAIT